MCADKTKYEHLAILSDLKSCQFEPKIVIFNLCICCQFEDLQIILPEIIPIRLWAITFNCNKWGLFFCIKFFSSFWYLIKKFLENLIKNYMYQNAFWCGLVLNGLRVVMCWRFKERLVNHKRIINTMQKHRSQYVAIRHVHVHTYMYYNITEQYTIVFS